MSRLITADKPIVEGPAILLVNADASFARINLGLQTGCYSWRPVPYARSAAVSDSLQCAICIREHEKRDQVLLSCERLTAAATRAVLPAETAWKLAGLVLPSRPKRTPICPAVRRLHACRPPAGSIVTTFLDVGDSTLVPLRRDAGLEFSTAVGSGAREASDLRRRTAAMMSAFLNSVFSKSPPAIFRQEFDLCCALPFGELPFSSEPLASSERTKLHTLFALRPGLIQLECSLPFVSCVIRMTDTRHRLS